MLSVIVPCHNEAGYIERLLASLVRQTFDRRCFEVVVVDNASTDSTAAEVREFARDGPLDLRLVSERILGVSIARNRGAAASRHDVLVFLDADNIVRPEFLEAVAATFADNRVAGATIRTDAEPTDRFGPWLFAGLDIVKRRVGRPFGKSALRRTLFVELGGYHEDISLGENVELLVRARRVCRRQGKRFVHLPTPITCSLRRFQRLGYARVLSQWMIPYLGYWRLEYRAMSDLGG